MSVEARTYSVVWRPLVLWSARGFSRLRRFEPLNQPFDLRTQRFNFAVLAEYNVAQLRIGALEESDFRLDLLKRTGLHDSGLQRAAGGAQPRAYPQFSNAALAFCNVAQIRLRTVCLPRCTLTRSESGDLPSTVSVESHVLALNGLPVDSAGRR